MNDVKMFLLLSGEMIVATVKEIKESPERYLVSDPIIFVADPKTGRAGFAPFILEQFTETTNPLELHTSAIVCANTPNAQLLTKYKEYTSKLVLPAGGLVTP